MKKNEHEDLKISVYGKYVQVKGANGVVATAKCNPIDEFNVCTGVKIALARYKEQTKEKQFKPYVCMKNCFNTYGNFGSIGEKSPWKDEFGEALEVGDTVKFKMKNYHTSMVSTIGEKDGKFGILGAWNAFRSDLIIVKLPRQKETEIGILVETYEEEQKRKREWEKIYGRNF